MSETRQVINALNRAIEQLAIRLTTNITAELIEVTPRDTGWAASNWIPSLNTPFTENSQITNPTQGQVSTARIEQQAGLAQVLAYRLPLGNLFIVNNVPYILPLNNGSSQQAPAMFIQQGIARGIRTLDGVVLS